MNETEQYAAELKELKKQERRGWSALLGLVIAILLFVVGLFYGASGDFARGAFCLILSHIVKLNAEDDAKKAGFE